MRSNRLLDVLVIALSTLSVTRASILDPNVIAQNDGELEKRADILSLGIGDDPTTSDTATTAATTTAKTSTTAAPTTTSASPSTSSSAAPSTSSTPTSSSSTPETTSSPTSSSEQPVSTITQVITTTNSDGSPSSYTTESTTTQSPSLSSSQGSTSGMSPQTRNTVIGVVVGVGGAIVLAAIALVAWRIWGRKRSPDENDGLVNYGGGSYNAVEKSEAGGSASGRTPFQSTLESYHAPTQVNTASNF